MEECCEDLLSDNDGEGLNVTPTTLMSHRNSNHNSDQSDEEELVRKVKKRTELFSDSDSEQVKPLKSAIPISKGNNSDWSSDEESIQSGTVDNLKSKPRKSRIKNVSSSEDSENETVKKVVDNSSVKIKQSSRLSNKKINLQEKLQSLQKSREKYPRSVFNGAQDDSVETPPEEHLVNSDKETSLKNKNSETSIKTNHQHSETLLDADSVPQCVSTEFVRSDFDDSSSSNEPDEAASIEKIKQKIKERTKVLKSTLLIDPDTSDEDSEKHDVPPKYKRKQVKQSSPKPARMSAKQAMENMQKIKSESNRMLREKDVSLPYHRPKALSLKDIMSRRKTVLTPDGKALPLKMNDEQLKLYAHSLEERQKEMIELCKSDTEDEGTSDNDENMKNNDNKENIEENNLRSKSNDTKSEDVDTIMEDTTAQDNDISFDVLIDNEKQSANQTLDDLSEDSNIQDNNEKNEGDVPKKNNDEESCDKVDSDTNNEIKSLDNISLVMDIDNQYNVEINEPGHENQGIHSEELKDSSVNRNSSPELVQPNTEPESQLISLHYSENIDKDEDDEPKEITISNIDPEKLGTEEEKSIEKAPENSPEKETKSDTAEYKDVLDEIDKFSDDEMNMDDIDRLIENADIIESTQTHPTFNSPMLIKDVHALTSKPRLAGAPGMVIDLDGCAAAQPKKLSGVELLKERFSYFAKLKTPEEIERAREKQIKPGFQHLRLKQELEEKIAEQKSLDWAKRLEEERQQHMEMDAMRGDGSDEEDDIDKMEAKLAEKEGNDMLSDSSESEPEENDMDITDKPRKSNPLLDNEAEESDCENEVVNGVTDMDKVKDNEEVLEQYDESVENTSDEDSSDDNEEVDNELKPKKGRILKAFEDSDEDTAPDEAEKGSPRVDTEEEVQPQINNSSLIDNANGSTLNSQDDEIQSAQFQKSISEDIFNTQDLSTSQEMENEPGSVSKKLELNGIVPEDSEKNDKLSVICETQPYDDSKFDEIAGMCSGSFSQNILNTQAPPTDKAATQEIGDDVLALCTGKFYDNQFISQQEVVKNMLEVPAVDETSVKRDKKTEAEGNLLKSILEELDGPDFEDPKPNKFFLPNKTTGENKVANGITQQKKRFMIDSDDESEPAEGKRPKKFKKKKLKDRALQISDDEDEISEEEIDDDFMSAEEDEADPERLVEYDSEENEVAVPVLETKKKRRKMAEFFEQEAELTSEDEWAGSGDEDEAGLDRMEREEGDSDRFNQAALQRELGQIHMRDVLDQDKREVRLIQELLLEDGDLGEGSRQRKFRWRNADGEEETGTLPDDLADTQEEEYESEEQWRKQRHEREVFLRQMMQKEGDENDSLNRSISRTDIIKANMVSKTMSALLLEASALSVQAELPAVPERKSAKDLPSPAKKPFNALQQTYRGSLLSRGTGSLARLAAIAAPLAGDSSEDAPKMGSLPKGKSNFVFATLSPSTKDQPKVSKRKNDGNVGTPQLMKKLKTDETRQRPKMSLLEHLKT